MKRDGSEIIILVYFKLMFRQMNIRNSNYCSVFFNFKTFWVFAVGRLKTLILLRIVK